MTSTGRTRSHRELVVWRDAVALALAVDGAAAALPAVERFGLGGRLRRAAGAVPVGIAAGHGCGCRGGYLDHLSGALGSLSDLQLQLMIVARQRYLAPGECDRLDRDCGQVRRQLGCLVASLHAPSASHPLPARRFRDGRDGHPPSGHVRNWPRP
ncbi:MAG: four helix bundle protein [Gemmatimonadaceae bacterium]